MNNPTEEAFNFIQTLSSTPLDKEAVFKKGALEFEILSLDKVWGIKLRVQPGNYNLLGTEKEGLPCDWTITLWKYEYFKNGSQKNMTTSDKYNKYGIFPSYADASNKIDSKINSETLSNYKKVLGDFARALNVEWDFKSVLVKNKFLQKNTGLKATDVYNWLIS